LAIVLADVEFFVCYYTRSLPYGDLTGAACLSQNKIAKPLLAMLPLFWRAMQCISRYHLTKDKGHLLNLGKYCTAIVVAAVSIGNVYNSNYIYPWIVFSILSTVYSFSWDIFGDWGLGKKQAHYKYLRDRLLYNIASFYYISIVLDLILRFMWTLTLAPAVVDLFTNQIIFTTFLAIFEVFRRAIWNIFRLENEQIANVGKYRTVHEIPSLVLAGENDNDPEEYIDFNYMKSLRNDEIPMLGNNNKNVISATENLNMSKPETNNLEVKVQLPTMETKDISAISPTSTTIDSPFSSPTESLLSNSENIKKLN